MVCCIHPCSSSSLLLCSWDLRGGSDLGYSSNLRYSTLLTTAIKRRQRKKNDGGQWYVKEQQIDSYRGEEDKEEEVVGLLDFFATCSPGLEELVAEELTDATVGAVNVKTGSAGVSFKGNWETGFKANLWLRSAVRILQRVASGYLFDSGPQDPVYEFIKTAVEWPLLLVREEWMEGEKYEFDFRTFSIQARVHDCSYISSSLLAETRAKDAICDALRSDCKGQRPNPPEQGVRADVPLFLSLYKDFAVVYRDMSGISLHMRGYREVIHKASLNEGIAAAMLTFAGFKKYLMTDDDVVVMDPMCGSGTILIEAALMASNTAPGLLRKQWPFMTWHDFDKKTWKACYREAKASVQEVRGNVRFVGNDMHEGALLLCARSAKKAGVREMIELYAEDITEFVPPTSPCLVVVNPPWGARLDESNLIWTWTALGRFLKRFCNRADVYVLSGNSSLTRQLQMKSDKKWAFTSGGIDCRLLHYYVLPPKPTSSHYDEESEEEEHEYAVETPL